MNKDITNTMIICKDCNKHFTIAAELDYLNSDKNINNLYSVKDSILNDYAKGVFNNLPVRCFDCRLAKKNARKHLKL